ncbi:MAG TPA: sigma-54-dependent Fis family transcriptional regulator [Deltaproteobacteria bacterium]|nr:MAG: sigma-54-dependent Fis family transcriptional regulator [Deltaproteobacteria bacterium]HDM78286.1 sigma-54-dependent Fis family transcriptional regulator [Deltaproteobacteria bacterium]
MSAKIRILVVDDELIVRESLKGWLKKGGYEVDTAASGPESLEMLELAPYDLLFLDIMMPKMNGLEVLEIVKKRFPETLVVMITAYGSVETAVKAMKNGANDYLMKPFEPETLALLVEKLLQQKRIIDENLLLKEQVARSVRFENIIGVSEEMQKIFEMIMDISATDVPVLITGETGTGKELIAKAIHAKSPRKHGPFIPINCGAFPEHLLETELFGHEKGAFTGAHRAKKGRIEMSHGGTLFLDEVGEIPLKMQVDLLRVLETKSFHRVGGTEEINVDFRILAATNRNLLEEINKGNFRQDFYYRLNVISLHIPPLRERPEDIPVLAEHFMRRYSRETNKDIDTITPEAMEVLKRYPWPGNVRELQNAIERAVVISKKRCLDVDEFSFLQVSQKGAGEAKSLEEIEKEHIEAMLRAHDWNISKTARALKINRVTLHKKIKKYGLKRSGQDQCKPDNSRKS